MKIIRLISCSGGKDSTASLLLALERHPKDEIIGVFADTGNEHEATYEYVTEYLPKKTGVHIQIVKSNHAVAIQNTRNRLIKIIHGEEDKRGKYRWNETSAKDALRVLEPTGNPFLDLCLAKGMFPSHGRQFCTAELKVNPVMEFVLSLNEDGYAVESWQGVRKDESKRRSVLTEREGIEGSDYNIYRPILNWTAQQTIDYALSKGLRVNDLYSMGMKRVGCMPCVNTNKAELREISARFPEHIDRIAKWEQMVSQCAKSKGARFLYSGEDMETIYQRVEWANTDTGGKQFMLNIEEPNACSSAYGLCE